MLVCRLGSLVTKAMALVWPLSALPSLPRPRPGATALPVAAQVCPAWRAALRVLGGQEPSVCLVVCRQHQTAVLITAVFYIVLIPKLLHLSYLNSIQQTNATMPR